MLVVGEGAYPVWALVRELVNLPTAGLQFFVHDVCDF